MLSRTRSDIDDEVCRAHRVLVMLDNQNRVAQIPEAEQRFQKLVVIPLVQTDGRLVQDVGHPDQPGSDLRRKPDPLRFSAGKSCGSPSQRQIIEADIVQKPDACPDLLQNLVADLHHLRRQPQIGRAQILEQVRHGHVRHLVDVFPADRDGKCLLLQTLPMAGGTGRHTHECLVFRLHSFPERLPVTSLHIADQALERDIVDALASLPLIMDGDLTSTCPINQDIMDLLRIISEWCVQSESIGIRKRDQKGPRKGSLRLR